MSRVRPAVRPVLLRPDSRVDVAIVGAGAAGIAAARRCTAAGLTVAVLEARDHVGGRCVTSLYGGHPIDLGAHWLHAGTVNPLVRLGLARGEPLRRSPSGGSTWIAGRRQSRATRRGNSAAFGRADDAIAAASRGDTDTDIASVMPPLGRWGRGVSDTLALVSGRPLREVSAKDFPSEEFGDNWFVRGGYGSMLARLASGLPIGLGCPVSAVDASRGGVRLELSDGGTVEAAAAIVTLPLSVLAAGAMRFRPGLPDRLAAAISAFLPGTYEHVILSWPDAPRGDDQIAKLMGRRLTLGLLSWMDGQPFHYLELDHAVATGRDRAALAALARDFIREQFGAAATRRLRVLDVTDWVSDPRSLGAWAVAPPGAFAARDDLLEPAWDRVWLAGEANTRSMWGTVGGAWMAGEEAADAAVRSLRAGQGGNASVDRRARPVVADRLSA